MRKTKAFWSLYGHGVTRSCMESFMKCPELFRLKYVEGLQSKRESYAAHFGNVIHACLDKLYSAWEKTGKRSKKPIQVWGASWVSTYLKGEYTREYELLRKSPLSDPKLYTDLVKIYGLTEVTVNAYLDFWEKDFTQKTWLALEEKFRIPFKCPLTGKPIPISGKRDADFEIKRSLWLFETKSKGRIDTAFLMDWLRLDLQVMLYMWSQWKDYGRVPKGVLYNLVRRTQLEPHKGEEGNLQKYIERVGEDISKRPDFYFMRIEGGDIGISDMKNFEENTLSGILMNMAVWYREQEKYHYKNGASCQTPWGSCDMLTACSRGDRDYLQKRLVPFPELEDE